MFFGRGGNRSEDNDDLLVPIEWHPRSVDPTDLNNQAKVADAETRSSRRSHGEDVQGQGSGEDKRRKHDTTSEQNPTGSVYPDFAYLVF